MQTLGKDGTCYGVNAPPARFLCYERRFMIIVDQLEKIINEHGSTPILRDNLGLLRDQVAALVRENASLKEKVITLSTQVSDLTDQVFDLTAKNETLQAENQNLKIVIHDYENGQSISRPSQQEIHYDVFHKG